MKKSNSTYEDFLKAIEFDDFKDWKRLEREAVNKKKALEIIRKKWSEDK